MFNGVFVQRAVATALGGVFLIAGYAKALDPSALYPSVESVLAVELSDDALFGIVAAVVLLETALAGLLLAWRWPRATSIAALGAMLLLTGVMVKLVLDPNAPPCACLGGASPGPLPEDVQASNRLSLARNVALLMLALWLVKRSFVSAGSAQAAGNPILDGEVPGAVA